ncbi:type II toxin-antitoxin system PemK/MazF family toxin (plasmid) [Rhizobium sullae]|uniref:Plasmid maintenance toxin (PemK-like) n=1 Tax=Rhizobium sullae TaxID=50338 RepID=A0A2N0DGZ7_RHISU|nr:mRNA interferase PemK [Rhizobium sullae]PKA45363.1 plasmid maintenance toxin (PemK-like) [Rhizobium sullae]UWU18614.1 type II toxin-antitoxin system PemK/MazF family toxin [Rhizobium sullae]
MLPIDPKIGWVFRYSYLWHRQYLQGREEGDKERPCLVLALVSMLEDGTRVVRVLPITHTPPSDAAEAIELPPATKRRLGLEDERSWIILTESNRFVWPGPDIRAVDSETGYYGPLPPALFDEVKRRFVELARAQRHTPAQRSE